jgi:hypothetical protein
MKSAGKGTALKSDQSPAGRPAAGAPKAKTGNELLKLLETSKGSITLQELLLHKDLTASIKAEVPEVLDAIVSRDPNAKCHLQSILDCALHAILPGKIIDSKFPMPRASMACTRVLCFPSQGLQRRLCRHPLFFASLREFPSTENGQTSPVLCGHFEEIIIATLRFDPDLLSTSLSGMLPVLLSRIDLLGYQEILYSCCVERIELFARPNKPVIVYRTIARCALQYAESYVRDHELVTCRRLFGVWATLERIMWDRNFEDFGPIACDLEFVRNLVQAAFVAPMEKDMYVAFRESIRCLEHLIRIAAETAPAGDIPEKAKGRRGERPFDAARTFIKQFAIGFYLRHNVRTYNWEDPNLNAEQLMLVDAFPVLWQGGIDYMFPLFFHNPPLSADFNRIMLQKMVEWRRVRFLTFCHEHHILDLIIRSNPRSPLDNDAGGLVGPMNPQIWKLAQFITFGTCKKVKPQDPPPVPYRIPEEYAEEYERFSAFVVNRLLPYVNLVENEKAKFKT